MRWSRREVLGAAATIGRYSAALLAIQGLGMEAEWGARAAVGGAVNAAGIGDEQRMRALAAWTRLSLGTAAATPFGAEVVESATGVRLMRALNDVGSENDPSAHAEVHTMRLACAALKRPSLKGYTLYTTCEPCPMCMSDALWAGVDRVVYGATIADANRFCRQIRIPAAEVVKRSDMKCIVDGPVEREVCVAIFADPRMQRAFRSWSSKS